MPHAVFGGVELKGANGTVIDFVGVREATEKGLNLMIDREQGEIFVLWTMFDLEDLKSRQPKVHQAYMKVRGGGQPVSLNLGLYDKLMTRQQMSADIKKRLEKSMSMTVPTMTEFFDLTGFDNRYDRGDLNSVYSSWERRTESYLREYERLLEEFFGLKPSEENRSTWTYSVNGKVKYRVYTEIKPPQKSASKRPLDFLHYFGDPKARDASLLVTYFRKYSDVHKEVAGVLDSQSRMLSDGLVMGETHEITVLQATVDDAREHLHEMLRSTSLSTDLQRDMEKYLRTWDLL